MVLCMHFQDVGENVRPKNVELLFTLMIPSQIETTKDRIPKISRSSKSGFLSPSVHSETGLKRISYHNVDRRKYVRHQGRDMHQKTSFVYSTALHVIWSFFHNVLIKYCEYGRNYRQKQTNDVLTEFFYKTFRFSVASVDSGGSLNHLLWMLKQQSLGENNLDSS